MKLVLYNKTNRLCLEMSFRHNVYWDILEIIQNNIVLSEKSLGFFTHSLSLLKNQQKNRSLDFSFISVVWLLVCALVSKCLFIYGHSFWLFISWRLTSLEKCYVLTVFCLEIKRESNQWNKAKKWRKDFYISIRGCAPNCWLIYTILDVISL